MTSFKNVPLLGIMDGFVRGCVCWLGCLKKNVGGGGGELWAVAWYQYAYEDAVTAHRTDSMMMHAKRKLEQCPLSHGANIHDEPKCMLQL